jgi:hypothetical protein
VTVTTRPLIALTPLCAAALVTAALVYPARTALAAPPHALQAASTAACPLKPSSSIPRGEAWAFTATGAPASAHPGVRSTYAHGRGTWTHGHGGGTICRADAAASGPAHDIVLRVSGAAKVMPHITRIGRLGASVTLNVTVSASDYTACAVGTRGTVTIFASYYQGHHDRVQLSFAAGCSSENATFLGPQLHALIAREGLQVNHA